MDERRVYIKDTTLKNKGIFAKVTLPAKTMIILEAPVLATARQAKSHNFPELEEKYNNLTPLEKFEWSQLWRPVGALKQIVHPWKFNCFIADPKARIHTLYISASRLNHSCTPNASVLILPDRRILVETTEKVFQGSEITISYDVGEIKRFKLSKDFVCLCEECGGPQEVFNYPRDEDGKSVCGKSGKLFPGGM